VIIVDEFTGRLMEGRRYSEGLHQAIEAKEGVKVQKESMTLATITFQNYFRMYNKLAGMTGTAKTEEEEFQRIYNLDVVQVPTYRPVVRADYDDLVYRTEEAKFKAVIDDIVAEYEKGRPVLVGTVAIETSEHVSNLLTRRGVQHEVLNAKNHEREATIIAQAGHSGAVTIATNMAGRGVDILLGGNAEGLARETLRRKEFDLSTLRQDEWNKALDLLKRGEDPTKVFPGQLWAEVLTEKYRDTEADKEKVRSLGGLYVVGTERHEARRIDNQLRGRSGRLGDPGASRFYLSLEDELMRKFGGDRIGGIMARLGVEEDVPIEAGLVNKAIENAQTKVEGYNFDTRKHVLRYDEVVNEQRNRIYDERRRILTEPSLKLTIEDMIDQEVAALVAQFTVGEYDDQWQLEELGQALKALVHKLPEDFTPDRWQHMKRDEIEEDTLELARAAYAAKEAELGEPLLRQVEKHVMLGAVDNRWIRHLTDLDRLREGIGLQAIAQVDPLVAYKREAFTMYTELLDAIRSDTVKTVFAMQLRQQVQAEAQAAAQASPDKAAQAAQKVTAPIAASPMARNIRTNRDAEASQPVRKSGPQLGRNDPCWCGSGKKYKNCHMQSDNTQGAGAQKAAAKR
jgi:preprotein translocase subunit SecA